jgi:hypothetical protein
MNPFDKLPSDVIIYMALAMDLPEIIKMCRKYKRFDSLVCQDNPKSNFWIARLQQDFNVDWNEKITRLSNYFEIDKYEYFTPKQLYQSIKSLDKKGYANLLYSLKNNNILLADYIIDYWNDDIKLNDGIMDTISNISDPTVVKYLFSRMNDEKINNSYEIDGNIYYRGYGSFVELHTQTPELYDLFLNKLDKTSVEFWIDIIANIIYDAFYPSDERYIEIKKILRKYEKIYDLDITGFLD